MSGAGGEGSGLGGLASPAWAAVIANDFADSPGAWIREDVGQGRSGFELENAGGPALASPRAAGHAAGADEHMPPAVRGGGARGLAVVILPGGREYVIFSSSGTSAASRI